MVKVNEVNIVSYSACKYTESPLNICLLSVIITHYKFRKYVSILQNITTINTTKN